MTHAMLMLLSPWIVGIVSLPTHWSQMVSTFRLTENASTISCTNPAKAFITLQVSSLVLLARAMQATGFIPACKILSFDVVGYSILS
jgi:hypothetical protein